jgi:hypothetical protein
MSIDNCQKCDKRLDTDFVEYQPDGSLYCGACEADIEEEKLQKPDWKALAGELADALDALFAGKVLCDAEPVRWIKPGCEQYDNLIATANKTDIGTMRIVAIQGAAEEYARQGNAVLANELWGKFGKEGGE